MEALSINVFKNTTTWAIYMLFCYAIIPTSADKVFWLGSDSYEQRRHGVGTDKRGIGFHNDAGSRSILRRNGSEQKCFVDDNAVNVYPRHGQRRIYLNRLYNGIRRGRERLNRRLV